MEQLLAQWHLPYDVPSFFRRLKESDGIVP
jgi:hypothetical protein